MRVRVAPRALGVPRDLGAPELPGSKSHAQRALLLAAFLPTTTRLWNVPDNDDLRVLRRALAARGVALAANGAELLVHGRPLRRGEGLRVDAGENATAARMLLALLPLLGGEVIVDGHPRLRRRSMAAVTAMLRAAGVVCDGDELPLRADGRALAGIPDPVRVDGAATTQAASGAMLAVALAGGGAVEVGAPRAPLGAADYPELTARVLEAFGAAVARREVAGGHRFEVHAPVWHDGAYVVPPDPSARAFVAALAAMHGLPLPQELAARPDDGHPDGAVDADFARLAGAAAADLALEDLGRRPDCVPVLAALAAIRPGRTTLRGLAVLRGKESDRLAALAAGLAALGGAVAQHGDDLEVTGPLPTRVGCTAVPTVPDHRIVMAFALLGTVLPGGVEVAHGDAVAKSWPGFFAWLSRCAAVERVP